MIVRHVRAGCARSSFLACRCREAFALSRSSILAAQGRATPLDRGLFEITVRCRPLQEKVAPNAPISGTVMSRRATQFGSIAFPPAAPTPAIWLIKNVEALIAAG